MTHATLANSDTDPAEAKRIILSTVGERARVYLYASRAQGTITRTARNNTRDRA